MKKNKRLIATLLAFQLMCIFSSVHFYAESLNNDSASEHFIDTVKNSVQYLNSTQTDDYSWKNSNNDYTAYIINICEYIYNNMNDVLEESGLSYSMVDKSSNYLWYKYYHNTDDLSCYLLVDELKDYESIDWILSSQNPDGGFGLAENYASDIIDTKLALKALADLGEMEAMTNAAMYIASLQNDDGGFSYQPGLASNPELTAEIADIFGDCIIKDQSLAYTLSETLTGLNDYLDDNMPAIEDLETNDMPEVYQHFHTALFKLKTTGSYNVTPYYDLQAADGGVFDDPMATALFLELIVREQNSLIASVDHITVTNDRGYSVSSFNANENVNIYVVSDYETAKAYLKVSIETPSGSTIQLNNQNLVWNTGNSEEGTYKVKAEIVRSSNQETVVSLTQEFRVLHRLSIDNLSLSLSQSYSRVGDSDSVSINADISLQNFSEDTDDVDIRWSIISNNEVIDSDSIEVTEADLAAETIHLTDFTPDTSAKRSYTISAELVSNNLVVVQASTNYFVSDKGVAVVTDVDKEYLYETSDEAEISVRLRDERVVDLIFTTSSQDTELITQYADQVDAIKNQLEHLGYIVNLSSVDTSYLTARDTFAWIEYDHPNYNTQSPYTKHIVYEEDNIQMLGYTAVPYKDFLLVPDDNDSRKIFTFDIQRDTTDWHSMNGGGFLFNTVIEDNTISGYYVLITGNGLKLYSLNALNLDTFRNTGNQGTLLQTFPFSNVYDEHHIVINADSESLSLWDGENIVINDYSLPTQYGNGYGPITSHASHGCSQRSYFTFANITMQTITGEKLSDVLDNYNFESPNSRYVINLSDDTLENLDTEDDYDEVAQKIIDNDITFIGLGNDSNRSQYQTLLSEIGSNGMYYDFLNTATETNLNNYIITREENKRVKIDNDIVATDLVFKGTLSDGTEVTRLFDELCVGETINFTIPTEPDNLTAGIDAVLLDNITLTYSDENGIRRVVNSDPVTLPVLMPETKITNQVSTDKPEYSSYQNVVIFDRIHNVFNNRSAKNLTNVITVLDNNDEVIEEYTSALPELMPNGFTERRVTWNTSDNLAGTYTVRSDVYDGDRLLSRSTADFSISISSTTDINLIGQLAISDKTYDVSDSITINTSIENVGHSAVTNAWTLIKIFDVENETVVYQYQAPLSLDVSEDDTDSITVVPEDDFSLLRGSRYLVTYEAVTADNRTIPLSSDGFELEGVVQMVTLYFVDNTQQHWVHNDNAVMELVDNTFGHDHYDMTKIDDVTWAAEVPASAYNITFNRFNYGKTTQWNSWSAGGRDNNNTYFADIAEHGHWGYVEYVVNENYFHTGDVIYLDLSDFNSWENDNAIMYANFSNASKVENGGSDINIAAWSSSELYQPRQITGNPNGHIYTYVVTASDEGKDVLRFWRGNATTLWNCSVTLDYDAYKTGTNCIKVTGWNSQGNVYSR